LSQTFIDTRGESLRVEFFMADDGRAANDFHAAFDDNMLLSLTNDRATSLYGLRLRRYRDGLGHVDHRRLISVSSGSTT
jgi:hypothetical protein